MHFHISTLMPLQNFLVLDISMLKFLLGEDIGFMMKVLSHHHCVCVCL